MSSRPLYALVLVPITLVAALLAGCPDNSGTTKPATSGTASASGSAPASSGAAGGGGW